MSAREADKPVQEDAPADMLADAPRGPRVSLKDLAEKARRHDAKKDGDPAPDADNGDDVGDDDGVSARRFRRIVSGHRALAEATLAAALPRDVRRKLMRGDPIAVVVAVPGPEWVSPIMLALEPVADLALFEARDGSKRRDHAPTVGNDEIANALRRGKPVIGVSQAPSAFLPATLLAAADAIVTVRPPDGPTLRRILRHAGFRGVPREVPAAPCVGLSFDDVQSALRRGATGRDVVAALGRMAARKAALDVDDGVPPLPDLPGLSGPARQWGLALIDAFAEWRAGRRAWRDMSASAVLAGPPGTGKTVFVRSLAKGLGVPLVTTSVGDWFARTEGHLGDVAKAFQDSWDRAMAARPACLFIDEVDAIPNRDTVPARYRDWWLPIIAQVLTQTDGAQTQRDGLVLLGATNYGARLDAALVRKGRFDQVIAVDLPTPADLAAVVSFHCGGSPSSADLLPVVRLTSGASAADAAAWARVARNLARDAGRSVTVADVLAVAAPPDRRSADAVRRVSVHEAAHAIVGRSVGERIAYVTIVEKGDTDGLTRTVPDGAALTAEAVDRAVVVGLAGRAAEEVVLGAPSSGAEGDLAAATALLAAAHGSVGLGAWLVHRGPSPTAASLLASDTDLRDVVEAHLAALYAEALALVRAHRDAIERVADALVARRFLTGDDVAAIAGRSVTGDDVAAIAGRSVTGGAP